MKLRYSFFLISLFFSCTESNEKLLFENVYSFEQQNAPHDYSILKGNYIIIIVLNPLDCEECDQIFSSLKQFEANKNISILPVIGDLESTSPNMKLNIEFMRLRMEYNLDARFYHENDLFAELYNKGKQARIFLLQIKDEQILFDSYKDNEKWFEKINDLIADN